MSDARDFYVPTSTATTGATRATDNAIQRFVNRHGDPACSAGLRRILEMWQRAVPQAAQVSDPIPVAEEGALLRAPQFGRMRRYWGAPA